MRLRQSEDDRCSLNSPHISQISGHPSILHRTLLITFSVPTTTIIPSNCLVTYKHVITVLIQEIQIFGPKKDTQVLIVVNFLANVGINECGQFCLKFVFYFQTVIRLTGEYCDLTINKVCISYLKTHYDMFQIASLLSLKCGYSTVSNYEPPKTNSLKEIDLYKKKTLSSITLITRHIGYDPVCTFENENYVYPAVWTYSDSVGI